MVARSKKIVSATGTRFEKARTVNRTINAIVGVALTTVKATSIIVEEPSPVVRAAETTVKAIPTLLEASPATVKRIQPAVGTTATVVEAILLLSERRRLLSKGFRL